MRVRYYRMSEAGELVAGALVRLSKPEQRRLAALLQNGEVVLCYQTVIDQSLPELQLEQSCDDDDSDSEAELDCLEAMIIDEVAHLRTLVGKEA